MNSFRAFRFVHEDSGAETEETGAYVHTLLLLTFFVRDGLPKSGGPGNHRSGIGWLSGVRLGGEGVQNIIQNIMNCLVPTMQDIPKELSLRQKRSRITKLL